jgi:hypothetical protein
MGAVGALPEGELDQYGSRPLYFFRASVSDLELWLNDVHLAVEWSDFNNCHFRERAKPVVNEHGFSAQGSFANSPAVYRKLRLREGPLQAAWWVQLVPWLIWP